MTTKLIRHLRPVALTLSESDVIHGYTYGETWNGFACPFLTKDQADKIADYLNPYAEDGYTLTYDVVSDAFSYANHTYPAVQIDGLTLYPIGQFDWTWVEEPSA